MVSIRRITLAAGDVAGIVSFYNAVIGAGLEPLDAPPGFHRGTLAGIDLLVCPNTIAEVNAEQNRHQFSFLVDDAEQAYEAGLAAGGRTLEPGLERSVDGPNAVMAWLYDPDGNSLELVERR